MTSLSRLTGSLFSNSWANPCFTFAVSEFSLSPSFCLELPKKYWQCYTMQQNYHNENHDHYNQQNTQSIWIFCKLSLLFHYLFYCIDIIKRHTSPNRISQTPQSFWGNFWILKCYFQNNFFSGFRFCLNWLINVNSCYVQELPSLYRISPKKGLIHSAAI